MAETNGTQKLKRKRNGAEPQRKKVKTESAGPKDVSKPLETDETTDGASSTPLKKPNATPKSKKEPTPTLTSKSTPKQTPQRSQPDGTDATPSTSTKTRKDKKRNNVEAKAEVRKDGVELAVTKGSSTAVAANGEHVERSSKKEKKQRKHKDKSADQWSVSSPLGGWFLPQDPVFSLDEKYLLLAKPNAVEVYATETSLLARELPVGGSASIVSYCISSVQPDQLYIADSIGMITLWNWTNGRKVGRWDLGTNVWHQTIVKQPGAKQDLLYAHEASSKSHVINVHALRTGAEASETELKHILKTSNPITGIQVHLEGKIVVVSTAKSVIIGKRTKFQKTAVQDFEYVWREFEMSDRITTFSSHVRLPDIGKGKRPQADPRDHLDLAIGDSEGVIHLFEDILSSFAAVEKSQHNKIGKEVLGPESLRPKRLHWHREAVGAVKWSLDGNYLISGGDETVLTIWQLSTGKQQHLPHLTAAIESVVVSPSGASYGISLANNSVIVLSTSELLPKANIIGLQTRRIDREQLLSHKLEHDTESSAILRPVPMAVLGNNNSKVIFATPSSQPHRQREDILPEPYAQTFNMATRRSISRQALTRNNATDPNVDPEGRRILEPNVQFVQTSHDGSWLATVDEWIPPPSALGYIEEGEVASNDEERLFRREVYLKIWRWDETDEQWVLDARIDAPHFHKDVSAHARVLDLVADPSGTGFATIGEDLVVRLWRPKTRTRDGMIVRGGDKKQGLVTWSLNRSIDIASKLDFAESEQVPQDHGTMRNGRLAFAEDGSVLAAGISWASGEDPGVIHMIDAYQSLVRRSITEIDVTTLSGLGIAGRYLVVVGTSIAVWDMILDQLVHSIALDTNAAAGAFSSQPVRLAVNHVDGTFAVSASRFDKSDKKFLKATSKVSVFDPSQPKAIWTRSIPDAVLALVAAKGGRGYIALDASSNIRTISPKATAQQLPTPPPEIMTQLTKGNANPDQTDIDDERPALQLEAGEELLMHLENDKPVVRPEQLREVFESGSSNALPAVKDMFDAIVGLYARKPRAAAAA